MRKCFLTLILLLIPLFSRAQNENLVAEFGKIWGYMKYFHPDVQKGKVDWDSVFVKYYPLIKNVADKNGYNDIIRELQQQVSVVRKLSVPYKYFPKDTTFSNLDFKWIINSRLLSESNKSSLIDIIINYKPLRNVYFEKERSNYNFSNVNLREVKPLNEAQAFLSFFTLWNRINYCFGYKKLMDIPWDTTLIEFIPKFEQACGKMDVYLVLAELVTRINDSHGVYRNSFVYATLGWNFPYSKVVNVKGNYFIRSIPDTLSKLYNIKVGDRIDSINGVHVNTHRKWLMKYTEGSNAGVVENNISYRILNLRYNRNNHLSLTDSFNNPKTVNVYFDQAYNKAVKSISLPNIKYLPYKIISNKYGYINHGALTKKSQLKAAFKSFRNCNSVIIDMRYNNRVISIFKYSRYLDYKVGEPFFKCYKMQEKYPGNYSTTNLVPGYWTSKYDFSFYRKKFKGSIVLLIDEHTQSTLELQTMWAKITCNAILVGRTTSGADGDAKPFLVNSYFGAQYTQGIILWPDGGQTQRIGIQPDILVETTREDIIHGRDEILEKALEYLETKNPPRF